MELQSDSKRQKRVRLLTGNRELVNTKSLLTFLIFVGIATLFWFIMAINDSYQTSLDVNLRITNVPDSVTFISDPPQTVHINIRDKGTSLLRAAGIRKPALSINFKEFASDGVMRISHSSLSSGLRAVFGQTAQISSIQPDSIVLAYSTAPGKKVPIVISSDITAAVGYVVAPRLSPSVGSVKIYSAGDQVDTVKKVHTELISKSNLSETTKVTVKLRPVKGVRIEPSTIQVTIPVEPLVSSQAIVEIKVINVPAGQSVLLFPSKIPVTYYTPMSHFNDHTPNVEVIADYSAVASSSRNKIPLAITRYPAYLNNVQLKYDSVEFTVVK